MKAIKAVLSWLAVLGLVFNATHGEIVHQYPDSGWTSGSPTGPGLLNLDGDHTPEFAIANDNFAGRVLLSGDFVEATADNTGATAEPGEPDHADISTGASLWWTWTAPTNGWATVTTTESAFAPCFAVYCGSTVTNLDRVAYSALRCPQLGWGVLPSLSQREMFRVAAGGTYNLAFDSPRSPHGYYAPTNAPHGQIRFALVFSTLEITSPASGATFFTDSVVPVNLDLGSAPEPVSDPTLELDGQVVALQPAGSPPTWWQLANLSPGSHTLRARAVASDGHERFSPSVEIQVRPANDDFARALPLAGTNFTWSGVNSFATEEAGETAFGACTVWYRWTAPEDGVARVSDPSGSGREQVAVFRGSSLTNLELVAFNPERCETLVPAEAPVYAFLHFSTRGGETYAIQVSSHWVGPMPMPPFSGCEPPWTFGFCFTLNMEFLPVPISRLDYVHSPALLGLTRESLWCFFAAPPGRQFVVERSSDLAAWTEVTRGTATGGMEMASILADVANQGFIRVRLPSLVDGRHRAGWSWP